MLHFLHSKSYAIWNVLIDMKERSYRWLGAPNLTVVSKFSVFRFIWMIPSDVLYGTVCVFQTWLQRTVLFWYTQCVLHSINSVSIDTIAWNPQNDTKPFH